MITKREICIRINLQSDVVREVRALGNLQGGQKT